jgi:hypothetical protein
MKSNPRARIIEVIHLGKSVLENHTCSSASPGSNALGSRRERVWEECNRQPRAALCSCAEHHGRSGCARQTFESDISLGHCYRFCNYFYPENVSPIV